uniref:Chromosome partition protein Smc n=1 Tax=Zeugodacus cucurbitae TaxID=28588 RepID=A0A0A1WIE3_ZEUCU
MDCDKCKGTIRGETGLKCEGVCKKVYQQGPKCSGIDQYSLKILSETNMVHFVCDDCLTYIHNMDTAMKEIQDQVIKSNNYLKEYKRDFQKTLEKNENELKQMLEAVEARFVNRMEELNEVQSMCKTTMNEVK